MVNLNGCWHLSTSIFLYVNDSFRKMGDLHQSFAEILHQLECMTNEIHQLQLETHLLDKNVKYLEGRVAALYTPPLTLWETIKFCFGFC